MHKAVNSSIQGSSLQSLSEGFCGKIAVDARQDYPWICKGQMLPTVPLAAQSKDVGVPSLFSEFPHTPNSACLEHVCQPLCQRGIPTQSNLYVLEMSISCLKK